VGKPWNVDTNVLELSMRCQMTNGQYYCQVISLAHWADVKYCSDED
jgi:hypothetical protein